MHLLVIVVGGDVDEQLEPFQENNFDTCPEEYLQFHDEEDDYRGRYLTGVFDCPWAKAKYQKHRGKPIREVFPTFDDFMEEVYGPRDERTGRYGMRRLAGMIAQLLAVPKVVNETQWVANRDGRQRAVLGTQTPRCRLGPMPAKVTRCRRPHPPCDGESRGRPGHPAREPRPSR
jgi:hypothetical protein